MYINRITILVTTVPLILAIGGCEKQTADDVTDEPATTIENNQPDSPEQPVGQKATEGQKEGSPPPKLPTSLDDLPDDTNAVQNEMQLLNPAMQNTLTLIANDTLEGIPGEIKNLHQARRLTEEAIKQGRYEPPVNADKMDEFKKLDEAFHRDLKGLLKAAKNDDLERATTQYGKLVNGCTECHTKFRFQ